MTQSSLEEQLHQGFPGEHIEKKSGYSYAGHTYMISRLNALFGFDGWDLEQIEPVKMVHKEEKEDGKWCVICTASVRLTVRGKEGFKTTIKEEVGTCGNTGRSLVDVLNTAHCGAMSFALKRCAHWLGNQFGASLYDSDNPLHSGGEDKWGILSDDEIDMTIQGFRNDIDGTKTKKEFDGVMQNYVVDLKRLPKQQRDNLREFSYEKLATFETKKKERKEANAK